MKEVTIKDDLDGSVGATTCRITYDDTVILVDLGDASREKLRRALAPFAKAGTVSVKQNGVDAELADIRQWALANGHQVAPKGRIGQAVMDAYAAAHPENPQS